MGKISIIIPVYNCEATIRRAVQSVLASGGYGIGGVDGVDPCEVKGACEVRHEVECIAVVSKSADDSLAVCRSMQNEFPQLVVLDAAARNVSEARNLGLDVATGDIIGFCDGDDYFSDGALAAFARELERSGADILACGFSRVDEDGRVLWSSSLKTGPVKVQTVRGDLINNPNLMGCVWNKLYCREVIGDIRFAPELTHCEDTEFNLRVLKNEGLRVCYTSSVFYNYLQNPTSLSNCVARVFDSAGNLRYLAAMERVRSDYAGDRKILAETGHKMATLCIDNYSENLSRERREGLARCLRSNIGYLVRGVFRYEPRENLRRIRRGIRILRGARHG